MRLLIFALLIVFSLPIKAHAEDPIKERQQQITTILELTRENIYNYRLMDTPEWKQFEAFLSSEETLAMNQKDFVNAFNQACVTYRPETGKCRAWEIKEMKRGG